MDVRIDGEVFVTLSERNIRDLLKQFEEGGNPYTSGPGSAQLVRSCEQPQSEEDRLAGDEPERIFLRVVVQDNLTHYGDGTSDRPRRIPGPGVHGDVV